MQSGDPAAMWAGQAAVCRGSPHAHCPACRLVENMQLEDWSRLSGLTGLTLRHVKESHHGTLAAVLPRMTALRSLVLADVSRPGLPEAGERCCSECKDLINIGVYHGNWGARKPASFACTPVTLSEVCIGESRKYPAQAMQGQQICS